MPRTRQYSVKIGSQQQYDQDFSGTQLLIGRVTYLERFAPKPNSAAVPVTPAASGNSLYALRQHTHQAKDITSGVLSVAIGGTGGNDKTTARAGLGLGSAATYNIPQTGNAAANQVSLGSDGRFTDARVPLPHAASHGTGQSDAISPASIGAEPSLGNPGTNGYVLSSTTAGVRSWIAAGGYTPSGSSNQTLYFSSTNTLSASGLLSNTGPRIGINTTTPSAALLEINDTGSSTNGTMLAFNGATPMGATSGSGVGVGVNLLPRNAGERLGYFYLQGRNNNVGGTIINAVSMEAFANQDWLGGNYGSYWALKVMPDGTSTRAEMLRVNGTGLGVKNTAPNSVLSVGGSLSYATRTVAAGSRTLDATDHFIFASSGVTITLPTAATILGRVYIVKMVGSGTVTISTTSSQTIDGSVGTTITSPYGVLSVISDGANWLSY